MKIAETERLVLRELSVGDAEFVYRLNLDPEVIKYTGDLPFENVEAARSFLKNYDHYKKYGFGRWGVVLKENQELIGWCGLKYSIDKDEFDIGFRFFKEKWGFGYATESAKASLELGFRDFQMNTIVGRAMNENHASIHVLIKVGLKYWKDDLCGEEKGVIYRIDNYPI